MLSTDVLERAALLGKRRIGERGGAGGLMLLLDADAECPATLGRDLLLRLRRVVQDLPTSVVLAKREYEAWFLAAASSLRSHEHVRNTADAPAEPENVAGAKEYLVRELLKPETAYSETVDQVAFTAIMDLAQAMRCRSFAKLYSDFARMIETQV